MNQTAHKPLLAAAMGQYSERTPVWFLRQAGRYLPEYQKIRAEHDFIEVCKSPELTSEVTLQPLRRFDLDASIIFSDILIPPMLMGQKLSFGKGHGPMLEPAVRDLAGAQRLAQNLKIADLSFMSEGLKKVKQNLKPEQTLIGFAGAPYTVASYMIEGQGSKNYLELKRLIYSQPKTFELLMEKLVTSTLTYLQMQEDAGAEVLMLFDSWAANCTADIYQEHVYPHMQDLLGALTKRACPVIYYPGQSLEHIKGVLENLNIDVLALDWRLSIRETERLIENSGNTYINAIQGNLDPAILSMDQEHIVRREVRRVLSHASELYYLKHIFNVGHGVLPTTKIESIQWALDEIRA